MVDFQQQSNWAAVDNQYHMNGQNHRSIMWLNSMSLEYYYIEN